MKVKVESTIDMNSVVDILNNHGLSAGGSVQRYVTTNLIRIFDGYVPMRTGVMKGSAIRNNAPPYEEIVYDGPQAKRLFYNPQYKFNEAPKRGGYWSSRAWADNKDGFLFSLQQHVNKGGFL